MMSAQNWLRCPLSPSACSLSCFNSQPLGVTEPVGSGFQANGARLGSSLQSGLR